MAPSNERAPLSVPAAIFLHEAMPSMDSALRQIVDGLVTAVTEGPIIGSMFRAPSIFPESFLIAGHILAPDEKESD